MQEFPPELPAHRMAVSGSDKPNIVRTKMESGPDRLVRIGRPHEYQVKVKWRFTADQARRFWQFLDAVNDGTDWFLMNLDSGGGYALHQVRIPDPVKWTRVGLDYEISATLETDQRELRWS